jgi:hypothetical protein
MYIKALILPLDCSLDNHLCTIDNSRSFFVLDCSQHMAKYVDTMNSPYNTTADLHQSEKITAPADARPICNWSGVPSSSFARRMCNHMIPIGLIVVYSYCIHSY